MTQHAWSQEIQPDQSKGYMITWSFGQDEFLKSFLSDLQISVCVLVATAITSFLTMLQVVRSGSMASLTEAASLKVLTTGQWPLCVGGPG